MFNWIHDQLDKEIMGQKAAVWTVVLLIMLFFGLAYVGASFSTRFGGGVRVGG